jgi:hypothetical protein
MSPKKAVGRFMSKVREPTFTQQFRRAGCGQRRNLMGESFLRLKHPQFCRLVSALWDGEIEFVQVC